MCPITKKLMNPRLMKQLKKHLKKLKKIYWRKRIAFASMATVKTNEVNEEKRNGGK